MEDNPADAQMMQMALQKSGIPVELTVIDDGRDAAEYFARMGGSSTAPGCDLVVLDLNLPRLSGFELLECIRNTEHLRGLPVVVMSGSVAATDVERCYQLGANSYICKPTQLSQIQTTVAQFIRYWSECAVLPSKLAFPLAPGC